MSVTLNDVDAFEVASIVYRRWATEFDALKRVKAEQDDGSDDWAEFHAARLESHSKAEAKWKALVKVFTDQMPRLM